MALRPPGQKSVPLKCQWEDVSWYKFKYFQILDKSTQNHFRTHLENEHTPLKQRRVFVCADCNTKTHPHMWSVKPANRQVLWLLKWIVSFVAFTWVGKITDTPQFILKVFRVDRKLENKVVSIFLEKNLGLRKMIHLRKNQVISQQSRKEKVTLLWIR